MGSRRKLLLAAGSLLAAASLIAAFLVVDHRSQPKHLLTVTPNVLYRSGLLRPDDLRRVIQKFGIRTLVNLLPAESLAVDRGDRSKLVEAEERIARELGVRLIGIPLAPETPPTEAQVDQWVTLFDEAANLPILVHCEFGVIRTGMMVALYEIERLGHSAERALEDLPLFGHDLDLPKREPMREFILGYVRRSDRATALDRPVSVR